MLSAERQQAIRHLVQEHGVVYVSDLVQRYATSASTIRRDLEQLGRQGLITRIHGGAVAAEQELPRGASRPAADVGVRIGRSAARWNISSRDWRTWHGRLVMTPPRWA